MTSYIYNMVDTWASGGGPYTSIKMNATDNDVGSASLLMDLQVGGASKFSVSKTGLITSAAQGLNVTNGVNVDSNFLSQNGTVFLRTAYSGTLLYAPGRIDAGGFSFNNDLILTRRAAANLRLGAADAAAPVAQTLSVQSVVAGTTNTAGTNLTITGSQGTGTGAGGSIIFQVAPAGSTGTAQNALVDALTMSGSRAATFANSLTVGVNSNSARSLIFTTANVGNEGFSATANEIGLWSNGSGAFAWKASSYMVGSGVEISWSSSASPIGNAADTRLFRDAANTLALRNGVNAQAYNTYGTYTDGSNYRRVALAMTTAGVATLKPEGAGTGVSGNVLHISGLPTSNPGPGILWNNAGTPAIGT